MSTPEVPHKVPDLTKTDLSTQVTHPLVFKEHNNCHITPLYQSAAFVFDSPDQGKRFFALEPKPEESGYIYTRLGNPTVNNLEDLLARLEGGKSCIAFGSGMGAAIASLMPFLKAGDSCIVGDTLYGCTVDLVQEHFPKYGIETITVNTADLEELKKAFKPNTKIIFIETPANPTNKLSDIPEIAKLAHEHKCLLVVDNTYCTPYFQKPIELGADMVIHSCTKYLNGHSDVVAGACITTTKEQADAVWNWRKVSGAIMSPFDAWLILRGIRTLNLRMDRISSSAQKIAEYLEKRPEVERVNFPGLPSFPQYELGKKIMKGYCGTFSFEMKDGYTAAKRLLEEVSLMTVCVSLGATDTLIQHPASMTHAIVPEALMRKQGLTPGMIRISIGLEDPKDLIADFEQAFECAKKPRA